MLPDLNRLRAFAHVFAARGVGAAAAELHVTQSAVSQSLRKLESELDAQLFVRARGQLVPTPAAEALFELVSPFLAELERGVDALHRARRELIGTVRVGAPAQLGATRVPALLAGFRAQHPDVRFELTLGHPHTTIPMLERGALDLVLADVFATRQPRQVGLAIERLIDEQLVLVGTRAYVRGLGATDTVGDLRRASYVAYGPRAPALHSWFAHHYRASALDLDIALAVESVQAVLSAIEAHMGLGVVPSHIVDHQVRRKRLVAIRTRRKALTNGIALIRLLDRIPSAAEKAVAAHLRDGVRGHLTPA